MRQDSSLNLIYNYLPYEKEGKIQSCYKILNFFSETGNVEESTLNSVLENFTSNGPNNWICFDNLDELGNFAMEVCKKLEGPEVLILSAQDYNLAVENTQDIRGFREIFRRYGTCLENPNKTVKKNVFTKLFN